MPQNFPLDGTIFAALGSKKSHFDVVGGSSLRIFVAGGCRSNMHRTGQGGMSSTVFIFGYSQSAEVSAK
jgi:hypothetical protein